MVTTDKWHYRPPLPWKQSLFHWHASSLVEHKGGGVQNNASNKTEATIQWCSVERWCPCRCLNVILGKNHPVKASCSVHDAKILAQIYATCIIGHIQIPSDQSSSSTNATRGNRLFVIAFAYHAARGDDLSKIKFHQEKMQQLIVRCFIKKRLEPFSHTMLEKPHTQSFFPYR